MIRFARMILGVRNRFAKAGVGTLKSVLFVMDEKLSIVQSSNGAAYQFLKVPVQSSP